VRFDLGDQVEVSIGVRPDGRGELLGELLLTSAIQYLKAEISARDLVARVRPENVASRRLFEQSGFRLEKETRDVLVFVRLTEES
jgi:Sortase and related acyltransferases